MKKITAVLLTIVLAFSFISCAAETPAAEESPSAPAASPEASATPSESAPASAEPSAAGTVGYITDEVDHHAREPYDIVYMYAAPSNLTQYMMECMTNLSERLNIKVTELTANGDGDKYVTNIETVALTKPDGIISDMNYEYQARLLEVYTEVGIPFISLFNSVMNDQKQEIVPVVMMNHKLNGQKQLEFLAENYKQYWGDVDQKDIGLLAMNFSLNADLQARVDGGVGKFEELFPGNPVFINDAVSGKMDAQTAYDLSSSTISANPEVKYWFVISCVEDMSIGVARASESLGRKDSILITGSGSSVLPKEWDAGYEGNWVANFAVSNYQYAVPVLCGLIAIIDGRATAETLWPEFHREGDPCAQLVVGQDMITKDNYKQYFKDIEKSFGIES
jgi:ABC-type sugar transport system substrate-binding protein